MAETRERIQQKQRTRRDLVTAAEILLKQGDVPTVPAVAKAAGVSRGTVYRFFPTQHMLLAETLRAVSLSMNDLQRCFERSPERSIDAEDRLKIVVEAVYDVFARNESAFRAFLRYSLEENDVPSSQRRVKGRFMWIDAALEPVSSSISSQALVLLRIQLAALLGIETFIVYRDICDLTNEAAANIAAITAISLLKLAIASATT